MKKYLILGAFILLAGLISAQTNTIQQNQKARINQGIQSGELTKHEAKKLNKQQHRISKTKRKIKADGVVTKREKGILQRQQNKASRNIYRKRHN